MGIDAEGRNCGDPGCSYCGGAPDTGIEMVSVPKDTLLRAARAMREGRDILTNMNRRRHLDAEECAVDLDRLAQELDPL